MLGKQIDFDLLEHPPIPIINTDSFDPESKSNSESESVNSEPTGGPLVVSEFKSNDDQAHLSPAKSDPYEPRNRRNFLTISKRIFRVAQRFGNQLSFNEF